VSISPLDCPKCGARYTSGVYIVSNAAMPGLVKIGHTTKSLRERMTQLSALTAVPMPFELEAWFPCAPRLARRHERELHQHFHSWRVPSREFFRVEVGNVVTAAEQIVGRVPELGKRALSLDTSLTRHRRFVLPELGEGMNAATILRWLVESGESVVRDQALLEVETDKATIEVPSPVSGRLVAQLVQPGALVRVGSPIADLDSC
jgi:hypothetical protein